MKFRHTYDPKDMGAMEYRYNEVARKCGIIDTLNVAKTPLKEGAKSFSGMKIFKLRLRLPELSRVFVRLWSVSKKGVPSL